ncbi:bifunctional DNA primase/polymerase [Luedemannella flava]
MPRLTVMSPSARRLWPAPQAVRRSVLRRAALRYADRDWPVLPGAFLDRGRYSCGPMCPTVACHPAIDGWPGDAPYERNELEQWWASAAFSVLFPTGTAFDVIEVPAALGTVAMRSAPPGPVAVNPNGHWMFFVAPGDGLRPELANRVDMVLHGAGSWVPAPPTYTRSGGCVGRSRPRRSTGACRGPTPCRTRSSAPCRRPDPRPWSPRPPGHCVPPRDAADARADAGAVSTSTP